MNFLMEHEHFTYPEALKYLARRYHIEIEETEPTPEEQAMLDEKESLFQLNAYAQKFFSDTLFDSEAGRAIGMTYFKNREFSLETIRKFQLGYSPEEWDAFTRHALENGYKQEFLEKTGLSIVKENKAYDRFRGRVIFPVHNLSGRILGFGGRILTSETNVPKYVNSPESEIYNKSQILYGLYYAKNAIIRLNNCCLVEGYTDVISLHQAGIENVVASSGTSLTTDQIRLIKRYTNNITILYDGDPAGIKASFRGIDMILEEGMNVRIVLFPDNDDPDSYARKHSRNDLETLITKKAQDFIRFKTGLLLLEAAGDPIRKASLIKEIVGSISLIPDSIYRSVYIKECGKLLDIPEQTLMNELNKVLRYRSLKKAQEIAAEQETEIMEYPAPKQVEVDITDTEFQERDLIRLMLLYANHDLVFKSENADAGKDEERIQVGQFIVEEVKRDEMNFHNPVYQAIFDEFERLIKGGANPDEHFLLNSPDEAVVKMTIDLLTSPYELSENWLKNRITVVSERDRLHEAVENTLLAFKARTIDAKILEIQRELKVMGCDGDSMILLAQLKDLKEINKKINAQLGRIVTR